MVRKLQSQVLNNVQAETLDKLQPPQLQKTPQVAQPPRKQKPIMRSPRCIPKHHRNINGGMKYRLDERICWENKWALNPNHNCHLKHILNHNAISSDGLDHEGSDKNSIQIIEHNNNGEPIIKQIKKSGSSILSGSTSNKSRKMTSFSETDKLGHESKNYHAWRMVLEGLFELNGCMDIVLGTRDIHPDNTPKALEWKILHNYAYAQITLSLHPNFLASLSKLPCDTNRAYLLWSQIAKLKRQSLAAHKLFRHQLLHNSKMCKGTNIGFHIKLM